MSGSAIARCVYRHREPEAKLSLPVMLEAVHAGLPTVVQDDASGEVSLDEMLVEHPDTTFILRVAGDSMMGAGIYDGDLLIVDKSLEPMDGDVVIAALDGEFTVKRLASDKRGRFLHAENSQYPDIRPIPEGENLIWGVVTGNYHAHRRPR